MPLILSIDTSLEQASVCISDNNNVLAVRTNDRQMDHASWIHKAIDDMMNEINLTPGNLAAVAVTAGPGSYTGLRVGMATAKGICYALNIPLVTESTLYLLAQRVKKEFLSFNPYSHPVLICPMIDARRMEVYTATYTEKVEESAPPRALILDNHSFADELHDHIVLFCGNGSKKWQNLCMHTNAVYVDVVQNVSDLAETASYKLQNGIFADLAYAEPAYLKNFFTGKEKVD